MDGAGFELGKIGGGYEGVVGADVGVLVGEERGEADRDGGSGVVGAGLEGDAPDNDVFADQFAATERIDVALDLAEAEAVAFQHGFEEGG